MLPNMIGLGAQRAGTTWLHECLRAHPDVFMAPEKELFFFTRHFDRGLAWYESHFAGAGSRARVGEITPTYLTSPEAVPRIAQVLPDARLFVVLREPVSRAYSAYRLYNRQNPGMSFREVCDSRGASLVNLSMYSEHMERVFRYFPSDRVHVMLYDDLQRDPAGTLEGLFRFLAIDSSVRPPATFKRYNHIVYPGAQHMLRRMGVGWLVDAVKATPAGEWLKQRHAAHEEGAGGQLPPAEMQRIRALFSDDVARLQTLIGRDLSHWR